VEFSLQIPGFILWILRVESVIDEVALSLRMLVSFCLVIII